MASTMVSSGTSASVVVKVRLPATCGSLSSVSRRRAKRSRSRVSFQVRPRTLSTLTLIIALVERDRLVTDFGSMDRSGIRTPGKAFDRGVSFNKAPYNTNDEPNQSDYPRIILLTSRQDAPAGRADRPGHRKRPGHRSPPAHGAGGVDGGRSGRAGHPRVGRALRGARGSGRMRGPGTGL